MKALLFSPSIPRFVASKVLGRFSPADPAQGPRLEEVDEPALPGDDWIRLRTIHAGICGSDTGLLGYKVSPDLSALSSFPAVLGHEALAEVVETGPAARKFSRGERVAVDPFLGCAVRGLEQRCAACASGFPCVCENAAGGRFAPGLILGTCADLPGSWAERFLAHESQLHRVDPALPDRTAALAEPLAIGLHAVLLAPPASGTRVLIVGGGPIAFAVLLALRMIGTRLDVSLVTELDYQRELALALGADRALAAGPAADEELARISGTRLHQGILGQPYPAGGFEHVYDCVGLPVTVRQSLRWTRQKGTFVLAGNASRVEGLDLTLLWAKEIRLQGTLGYGLDEFRGEKAHTFEWLSRLIGPHADRAARLVTHVFPLESYPAAIAAALDRRGCRSVKVLFEPGGRAQ